MFPLFSSLRTKAPYFVVWSSGSFHTRVSLKRNCTSAKLPRSILIPASSSVTPDPASPLLRTIILSLISRSVEFTVDCVQLTTRFPVIKTSPTVGPVFKVILPESATSIE